MILATSEIALTESVTASTSLRRAVDLEDSMQADTQDITYAQIGTPR